MAGTYPNSPHAAGEKAMAMANKLLRAFLETREITLARVVDLWRRFLAVLPTEDECDEGIIRDMIEIRRTLTVSVPDCLLKGSWPGAAYTYFLVAIVEDYIDHGPKYIQDFFNAHPNPTMEQMIKRFITFERAANATQNREKLVKDLEFKCTTIGKKDEQAMQMQIARLHKQKVPAIWLWDLNLDDRPCADKQSKVANLTSSILNDNHSHGERMMDIIIANVDNGKKFKRAFYKDVSLSWFLRMYVVPTVTNRNLKSLTHGVKTINVAESGNKSLHECGIREGDEIQVRSSPLSVLDKLSLEEVDVARYWEALPGFEKILIFFTSGKDEVWIEKELTDFCNHFIETLPSDKEFDIDNYKRGQKAIASSYVLAADFLFKGRNLKAVYMIFYAALVEEVAERGPEYMRGAFEVTQTRRDIMQENLGVFLGRFRLTVSGTQSRGHMIEHLTEAIKMVNNEAGKTLACILSNVIKQEEAFASEIDPTLHTVGYLDKLEYKERIKKYYGGPMKLELTTANVDNGSEHTQTVYSNTTLSWWLKIYVIKCNCHTSMNGEGVTPSTTYLRVLHKKRPLFLSSTGKSTFRELMIKDGGKIIVGGVVQEEDNGSSMPKVKSKAKNNNKKKGKTNKRSNKKQSRIAQAPALSEEQIKTKQKQEHSQAMTPVFDELRPILKNIRNQLNNLTIQKSAPKVKKSKVKAKNLVPSAAPIFNPANECTGGKAGKTAYPVLVGDVSNLYKTSKSASSGLITLDLHGCTKDEALEMLGENFLVWVDTAMKGEYPWVIPVDIVCGGGNQILSEVVKGWVRNNLQVANRPKGYA